VNVMYGRRNLRVGLLELGVGILEFWSEVK
jgi:hypothetical protein